MANVIQTVWSGSNRGNIRSFAKGHGRLDRLTMSETGHVTETASPPIAGSGPPTPQRLVAEPAGERGRRCDKPRQTGVLGDPSNRGCFNQDHHPQRGPREQALQHPGCECRSSNRAAAIHDKGGNLVSGGFFWQEHDRLHQPMPFTQIAMSHPAED